MTSPKINNLSVLYIQVKDRPFHLFYYLFFILFFFRLLNQCRCQRRRRGSGSGSSPACSMHSTSSGPATCMRKLRSHSTSSRCTNVPGPPGPGGLRGGTRAWPESTSQRCAPRGYRCHWSAHSGPVTSMSRGIPWPRSPMTCQRDSASPRSSHARLPRRSQARGQGSAET
jgi:hypothetical protein